MRAAPRVAAGFPSEPLASPALGLPKAGRLRNSAQFKATLASPCVSRDSYFTVYARPNGLESARLGVGVSARIARTAVARNRIKRHVREAYRHAQQELRGLDVVVLARAPATRTAGPVMRQALNRHWQRITQCKASS